MHLLPSWVLQPLQSATLALPSLLEPLLCPAMQELPHDSASLSEPMQGLGMPLAGMPGAQDNSARHLMQMQMQGMNLQQMQGMGITGASCSILHGVLTFHCFQEPYLPATSVRHALESSLACICVPLPAELCPPRC